MTSGKESEGQEFDSRNTSMQPLDLGFLNTISSLSVLLMKKYSKDVLKRIEKKVKIGCVKN